MTPAFHETFWVVSGTAGPVIGLAAVVTAAEGRQAISRFRAAKDHGTAARREAAATGLAIVTWAYFISGANVSAQAALLGA